ncbi:dipeptidase [Acidobacteria bacterium AH-259-A15]|nr:dipeptidase [Acidobacteria bacterium AH-259-A15]
MKSLISTLLIPVFILGGLTCRQVTTKERPALSDEQLKDKAAQLAQELIIVDTHIDVPDRLTKKMEDISVRTQGGDFDYPRARIGGLNVAFMSIYIPAGYQEGGAKELAGELIDLVEGFASQWPDKFVLVRSVAQVRRQFAEGKISLPMGMENGAAIEGQIENLEYFYNRGTRYITLTHSKNNLICDSSYDPKRKWNGLSPFGREVVAEMNRLGMMIDVSHVSDQTFFQVLELSKAPVIASHSSCRYFTPAWERNISDEMLVRLKENGGVIQINFGSSFVNDTYRKKRDEGRKHINEYLRAHSLKEADEEARQYMKKSRKENFIEYADISDVVANIDHVVQLIGVDHVGFGSDFDGLGDSLPNGLKDVSDYPNLIYELLKRGYSEEDIRKICSGNLLRVWSEVERVARKLQITE